MKNPFRRKQNASDTVPTEIKQYYTEEARDQRSASWLTGVFVFVVTVALVLGLFYGGRALYRAVTGDDQPAQTTEQSADQPANEQGSSSEQKQGDQEVPAPSTDGNSDTNPDQLPGSSNEATPTPESTDSTPQTGPSDAEEIPRTGPELDL